MRLKLLREYFNLIEKYLVVDKEKKENPISLLNSLFLSFSGVRKGTEKRATCFATLLQNEVNTDVVRFTTHIKPVLRQIRLLTGLNMSGKTRNIAFQLVLQQCFKTSCSFFVACFSVPYAAFTLGVRARRSLETNVNTPFFQAPIFTVPVPYYKVESLHSGTRVGTGFLYTPFL